MGSSTDLRPAGGPAASRRIGILGFAETVMDAPFGDPTWELWGMNGLWRVLPDVPEARFAKWFELHTPEYIATHEKVSNIGTQQSDWLKRSHPFPVFMQQGYPQFPSSVPFPVDDLILRFGRDYFTSSVALELVYAMAEPAVTEIGLWGIDLVHGTEWGDQRPCAEYWIGRAEAMGIKVTVHERSALLKQRYRYAYEEANPVIAELKAYLTEQAKATAAKLAELTEANDRIVAERQTNDGAAQLLKVLYERLEVYGRGGRI